MGFDTAAIKDEKVEKPERNLIQAAVHEAVGVFGVDESKTRDDIEGTASEFLKAVPLFIGGSRGLALSAAAYGLGEVKVGRSLGEQGLELAAGVAKGLALKSTFDTIGGKEWGFAAKGMAMGSSSRLIETALTPDSYMNKGRFELTTGLGRAALNAGDFKALGVDVLTFGAARYMPGALSGKLAGNAALNSTLTGATFGFTSGTLGELQSQWHRDQGQNQGQGLDFNKILAAGAKESLLMGAAAATGHALTAKSTFVPKTFGDEARPRPASEIVEAPKIEAKAPEPPARLESPDVAAQKEAIRASGNDPFGYTGFFLRPESIARAQTGLTINGENVPMRWTQPTTFHVTDKFGIKQSDAVDWSANLNGKIPEIKVLGLAVDATGVEALHVSVGGKTVRDDGRPYHVTRSLAEGRRANESMVVVEKALEVQGSQQAGTAGKVTPEDAAKYSYQALQPHEQFTLQAIGMFRPTEMQAPKEKESKPKPPEVPFDQLPPKQQVINAIKATDPAYLAQNIATRTPEHHNGSYFDLPADKLKQALFSAKWEPYNPLDAAGNPIITDGARGYRATIEGGRLGLTPLESVPQTTQLYLTDPKGTNTWSLTASGESAGRTNVATMIVGLNEAGQQVVLTFHPGEPIRPSRLDTGRLTEALIRTGIALGNIPAAGPERRVPISRDQLAQINAGLPEADRMNVVKTEGGE